MPRNQNITKNTIEGLSIGTNVADSDSQWPSSGPQLILHPPVSIDEPHLVGDAYIFTTLGLLELRLNSMLGRKWMKGCLLLLNKLGVPNNELKERGLCWHSYPLEFVAWNQDNYIYEAAHLTPAQVCTVTYTGITSSPYHMPLIGPHVYLITIRGDEIHLLSTLHPQKSSIQFLEWKITFLSCYLQMLINMDENEIVN